MKKNRFISFGIFLLGAIVLIFVSNFVPDDYYLTSILCFVLAVVTFVPAILDSHLNYSLRLTIMVVGLLFFIASMLGLLLEQDSFPLAVYCLVFGIIEIINGIFELNEAVALIKEKNYVMGILFILDSLIEVVLGILMVIERHSTLRLHITLIASDLAFEGTIKLINEYVEDRRGVHE